MTKNTAVWAIILLISCVVALLYIMLMIGLNQEPNLFIYIMEVIGLLVILIVGIRALILAVRDFHKEWR